MSDSYFFFDRDISWLSFNERVLMEAEKKTVPLLERLNFIAIFSSNLDEFYRVRMPALNALHRLYDSQKIDEGAVHSHPDVAGEVSAIIHRQQDRLGKALRELIPDLQEHGIELLYNSAWPAEINPQLTHYFFTQVLAFIKPVSLTENTANFFPENNKLYLAAAGKGKNGGEAVVILNIPTEYLPRFYTVPWNGKQYIVFIDDIIRANLHVIPGIPLQECFSFKVTRDAELNLDDVYQEDLAEKIERQIIKRDLALATRFLYEPAASGNTLKRLVSALGLSDAVLMKGGRYHNLKDLSSNGINAPALKYEKQAPLQYQIPEGSFLLDEIENQDILLHTPYHSYDTVLRYFNEAAIKEDVEHIYLTVYRVASDSRIINALLSAAQNGKKVTVIIELKARFDESNNIKWARILKKAGVEVLYTRNELKVHAKTALVKRKRKGKTVYAGLLSTGNLNESTARFYTDHILLTSNFDMLQEVERLFGSFQKKKKTRAKINFNHLLVAQYNLQERFLWLIEREIENARRNLPARIVIKMNNLQETVLIKKLYEASNAGVKIDLIVRSICCIVPGLPGMSENITVRRIVDRYLEHGRVYLFHNNDDYEIFLGSADWMDRNIYSRIEVCFPIYAEKLKKELVDIINLQLKDNVQAVQIAGNLQNSPVVVEGDVVQSQVEIYKKFSSRGNGFHQTFSRLSRV